MALNVVELVRKLDRLLTLEETHGAALRTLSGELAQLRDRVIRLESRESVVIAEAKGASSAAASAATTAVVADLARRIGALEERSRRRLAPPGTPGDP